MQAASLKPLLLAAVVFASITFAVPVPLGEADDNGLDKSKNTRRRGSSSLSTCTYHGSVKTCTINKVGGIVIGVVLGVFVLLAASIAICAWRSKRKQNESDYKHKLKESRKKKKNKKKKGAKGVGEGEAGSGSESETDSKRSSPSSPPNEEKKDNNVSDSKDQPAGTNNDSSNNNNNSNNDN